MVMLYCESAPALKLGPGPAKDPNDPDVIRFNRGFAEIADDDPRFDEKMAWVRSSSEPIDVGEVVDRVLPSDPDAFVCSYTLPNGRPCGKAFTSEKSLTGHRFAAHAPRRGDAS